MVWKKVFNKESLIIVFGIMLCSIPLFFQGIEGHFGQDLGFHLNRIEGLYLELKNGVFPVKMQSFWMDGYGYPVSVYYGDILLYVPAALRLMGMSVVKSYKCYVLLVNISTVLVGYYSFKNIFKNKTIGAVLAIAYALSTYRLINIYIRAAVGEYSAMIFLPLVALGLYLIYSEDVFEWNIKNIIKYSTILGIGVSGVVSTHLLTAEIVAGVCLVIFFIFIKKSIKLKRIITLLVSIFEVILLNLYFLIPFIDYMLNVDVNINNVMHNARRIQGDGADLLGYVAVFSDPYKNVYGENGLTLTLGILLVPLIILTVILIIKRKSDSKMNFYFISVLILIFAASNIFPWDFIQRIPFLGNIVGQIQFPWRLLGIASVFMALLLGEVLRRLECNKIVVYTTIILIAVSSIIFAYKYNIGAEYKCYEDTDDLNSYDMGFIEYLRNGTNRDLLESDVISNQKGISIIERKGTKIALSCKELNENDSVVFPVINYKGYKVYDDNNKEYEIIDGVNNILTVRINEPYSGKLTLDYYQSKMWVIGEVISLITLIGVIVVNICVSRRNNNE